MAITTVQSGSKTLKAVRIKSDVIGPGGAPLFKGKSYQVPEADAYTLLTGQQADILTDAEISAETAKPAAPPSGPEASAKK
jgi:hypothetical protein